MNRIQGGPLDPGAAAARLLRVRAVVRAPLFLYRHGLGWVLGHRMLMLEHLGRRSGQSRYVCLEVVDNPADGVLVVASGFGDRAQWFRNLQANGAARVSIGRLRSAPADVTFLDQDAAHWCLERYQAQHPKAWKTLRGTIENASGRPVSEVPLVALSLAPDAVA
ncbi:nitroreductase family deazaflavin-dependent oxidoreductase [Jongsikchunia kroppenstedtii]|uniref:nitroreductase family deazaflavin-dependent oxidoreductase n=1 Tax=Jongsikchunia kroppenstedtii TaxID=1121721 RepID=UPI00036F8D27|nr:nitroreductase family deazaflavin-dependent oxidoreductase [Jongsikchunia kroppenstedtii]